MNDAWIVALAALALLSLCKCVAVCIAAASDLMGDVDGRP